MYSHNRGVSEGNDGELNIKCFYFGSASSEPYTSMHVLGILRLSAPEKH